MSLRTFIWIVVVITAVAVISCNARLQFNSAKNEPVKQYIEEASITLIAPSLEKKTANEEQIKNAQKDFVGYAAVYGVFYKKVEYSLIYTLYKNEISLEETEKNIINVFDGNTFEYDKLEYTDNEDEKIRLSGTFIIDRKKFGAEILLIKRNLKFWQILSVYPFSEDNKLLADNYIDSVTIDELIIPKPEKKK